MLKVKNRAKSTLANAVSDTDITWVLATGEGALFPTSGDFHVTCEDEIVKCTARSTDSLTVVRGQEDTTAVANGAGKFVKLNVTAGIFSSIESDVVTLQGSSHPQSHTIASHDTTATGTQLNELVGGSETSLHSHVGGGGLGYTLHVQALTSSPADGATVYFGQLPKAPMTTANASKVYIRKAGTIKIANIYCYSTAGGSTEAWSLYIRKNNTTDYLIATLTVSTLERVFSNTGLNIAVSIGDYFEIKGVQPTWGTNPTGTVYGGYIYIE